MPVTSEKDLSPDQRETYKAILRWKGPGILTVGGLAGTGKSTLIGVLAAERKPLTAYVTYTGRAVSILRRKLEACRVTTTTLLRRTESDVEHGWDDYFSDKLTADDGPPLCTTIHRLLYVPVVDPKTEELRGFKRRSTLDRKYALIVVDEASMIGDDLLKDLASFGVPVLAVGDHGQLPPVMATGNLMKEPALRLEKIHRQAEGSPIIALAHHIRAEGRLDDFPLFKSQWRRGNAEPNEVQICSRANFQNELSQKALAIREKPLATGILCYANRTRIRLNAAARCGLGYSGPPRAGEPTVCLRNKPPVYNGMRGIFTKDAEPMPESWYLSAEIEFPDERVSKAPYNLCGPQFNREKTFGSVEELQARGIPIHSMGAAGDFYDFGYAMTVHKSQGSQFDRAFVYLDRQEKPWEEEYRRWMYTAVTRAAERLTVFR